MWSVRKALTAAAAHAAIGHTRSFRSNHTHVRARAGNRTESNSHPTFCLLPVARSSSVRSTANLLAPQSALSAASSSPLPPIGSATVVREPSLLKFADRFQRVLSFHGVSDGRHLAAVTERVGSQCYHIDSSGNPAYGDRFDASFGFYCDLAAVSLATPGNSAGCSSFHIRPDGTAAYESRWAWCGNFSRVSEPKESALCPVRDSLGSYFHIDTEGRVMSGPHSYCGDFNTHGEAIVWDAHGQVSIVDSSGRVKYGAANMAETRSSWLDATLPHKGIACVQDSKGWLFVDAQGRVVGDPHRRFQNAEVHYNGQARVRLLTGQSAIVDENGSIVLLLPESVQRLDSELIALSQNWWSSMALKKALELDVLTPLLDPRSAASNAPLSPLAVRVLHMCAELGLCTQDSAQSKNGSGSPWSLTAKGRRLLEAQASTGDRCRYWLQDRYFRAWMQGADSESMALDTFSDLAAGEPAGLSLSQRVLASYAAQDWRGIAAHLPLAGAAEIVDIAGGTGSLLREIAAASPQSHLVCVERPEVVRLARQQHSSAADSSIEFRVGDLFVGPLPSANLYFLSRVLHDWPDERVIAILTRIRQYAPEDASLVVIDRTVADGQTHAALSLHMYMLQRARERTDDEWLSLFKRSGWQRRSATNFNGHTIAVLKKQQDLAAAAVPAAVRAAGSSSRVCKAVVPIAGLGTRLHPQTTATAKALLPIIVQSDDKSALQVEPALHVLLTQLLASSTNLDQVCIVASTAQLPQLHQYLSSLRWSLAGELECGSPAFSSSRSSYLSDRVVVVLQRTAAGFGDAVLRAESFVGQEPFLLVLGDHLFTSGSIEAVLQSYEQMMQSSQHVPAITASTVALTGVCLCEANEVRHTGLVQLDPATVQGQASPVLRIAEKPSDPFAFELRHRGSPSGRYLSHLGLDVLPPSIFDELRVEQQRAATDLSDKRLAEVDLRRAMQSLQTRGQLFAVQVAGTRLDLGNPTSYWNALQAARSLLLRPARSTQNACDEDANGDLKECLVQWLQQQSLPAAVLTDLALPSFLASAPGRVDLVGGFADYSGSAVLQFPIALRTYTMVVPTHKSTIELCSVHVQSVNEVLEGNSSTSTIVWNASVPMSIMFDADCTTPISQAALRVALQKHALVSKSAPSCFSGPTSWPSFVIGSLHAIICKQRDPRTFAGRGFTVVLVSDLPNNVGLASSAAVEVSVALAASRCLGVSLSAPELALLCQSVENRVVGAACGFMDQMTAACASKDALMALTCQQPLSPKPFRDVMLPPGFDVVALSTDVKRSVADSPYERVRTAAMMGRMIIQAAAVSSGASRPPVHRYLCELSPSEFVQYRSLLPVSMSGRDFRAQHGSALRSHASPDDCSEVRPDWHYPILAATAHPIEENARVAMFTATLEAFHSWPTILTEEGDAIQRERLCILAELMAQSHVAYSSVGLGSAETDLLVSLVRSASVTDQPHSPIIGSKVTGGGCGGTVAVLTRATTERAASALSAVTNDYRRRTGRECKIIRGSSGRMRMHGTRAFSTLPVPAAPVTAPRVLLVNHGFPPQFNGGSEVYTQSLAIGLLRSGRCETVDVFSREHDPYRSDFSMRQTYDSLDPRLKLHLINHAREAPYNRFVSSPIDDAFAALLTRLRPDIVHFGHLNHLSLTLPEVARSVLPQVKLIYTLHDFWLACPRGQFVEAGVTTIDGEPMRQCDGQSNDKCSSRCYAGRFATGIPGKANTELDYWTGWIASRMDAARSARDLIDCFISPSVHLMKRMQKEFEIAADKTVLLPYGFDRSRLQGRTRAFDPAAPLVFGYIGRHQPSKGLQLIIQAAIQLVSAQPHLASRFRVLLWGRPDASTHSSLLRMVRDSVLGSLDPPLVEFRPEYANHTIVANVFNHLDAIIVPSIWDENSPLVIHEAQQVGVPVITSEHGGMGELVSHGVNGLTFKHRSSASLAYAMLEAIHQPKGMMSLGKRGYLHSVDREVPSMDTHIQQVMQLYQRLAANESVKRAQGAPCPEYEGLLRLAGPSLASQPLSTSSVATAFTPSPAPIVPLSAPWRVTFDTNPDDCSFSCTMCEQHSEFSPHQRARKASGIRRRRMDFDLIRRTVSELAPLGLREIIPTTMGEPLMYKYFPDFIELCHQYNVKMNLTTNGSFWGRGVDAWARLIVPVTVDVKISWNGASEHTQRSIMKGSTLAQQIANLDGFIQVRDEFAASSATANYCSVTLQLTFMEQNLSEIPAIVSLAIAHGCDRVKGHHLWAHFSEIKDQDLRRSKDAIKRWNTIAAECRRIAETTPLRNGKKIRLDHFFDLDESAASNTSDPAPSAAACSSSPAALPSVSSPSSSPIHPEAVCPFLGKEAWINHAGRFDPSDTMCTDEAMRRLSLSVADVSLACCVCSVRLAAALQMPLVNCGSATSVLWCPPTAAVAYSMCGTPQSISR